MAEHVSEEVYRKAWEAGDSAIDWANLPAKTRRFFKRQIDTAGPFIAAKAVEEKEEADRKERLKRLLGEDWPRVTMLRDKGAKSSPPWCWWMEDDGYDHDRYEAQDYVPASSLDQAVQQERDRWEGWLLSMLEFSLYLRTLRNPPSVPRLIASVKRALQGKDAPKLGAHLGADAERQVRAALDDQEGRRG